MKPEPSLTAMTLQVLAVEAKLMADQTRRLQLQIAALARRHPVDLTGD